MRLTELSLQQLGEIEIISVSKQPEQVWQTPAAVHVITQEDIRRSGATTLPELLRLAPGVEVARIDSDHWAVGVRGFADQFSKSLLVLIDGRSIYTPLFAGMYWPAHDTVIEDIERIEVIRGPGGTIWGANAVNGVINIITRSAAETRGTLLSAAGGNIDRGVVSVRHGGSTAGGVDYRVYAKGAVRGPQFHADAADFDDWWTTQAGFRADWAGPPGHRLTLQGELSRGSHGQRVSIASLVPAAQRPTDGYLEATGAHLRARWQRDFSARHGFRLQAYYDRTSWLAPHFGESRDTVDVDFVHRLPAGARQQVTWGTGARRSPGRFTQVVPTLDFTPRRHTDAVYSGFVQDEVMLVRDRLWATVGAKLEHNSYTGLEAQPGVRLLWMARPGHTFWSAVTRAVRTPSRIERSFQGTNLTPVSAALPVFRQVSGNPDFDAERLVGYQAGYRTLLGPRLYLDAAVFHNEHDRLGSFALGSITVEGPPPASYILVRIPYVNDVAGTSDGFEISPDWRPTDRWQVKGSYSHVRFDLATTPTSIDSGAVARYEGVSPHHQVRLQSHLTLPRGVELDAAYRYVSRLPALLVDAYHTADVRLAWRLSADAELFMSGQNLVQPHHVEFGHGAGVPVGIARSVLVGWTWRRNGGS